MTELMEEQYVDMEAEDFLELVYGTREGWIDLPAKVGAYWVPFHTEWPAEGTVSRRIDSSLRDREDLYYSVAQFAKRGRRIEDVLPSVWLWADLDEVHPTAAAKLGFLPTVAVESSPGRYQALWRLTREVSPGNLERLNRGLTYALDADRGGWDLTQVLRIPGTRNFKYPEAPLVKLMWHKPELEYDPKYIWREVKKHVPTAELELATMSAIVRVPIPSKAKRLLRTAAAEIVEGERSHRLWELECMLLESGLSEEEVFSLVWPSAWNKWTEVSSGQRRLKNEIHKAATKVAREQALKGRERHGEDEGVQRRRDERSVVLDGADDGVESGDEAADDVRSDSESDALPFVGYASFMAMAMEEPKWLIENIWTAGSHGIIGGEPKTQKTSLALALGLSVASGSSFLGQYAVGVSGPVLMVQEENAPWMMQDRLRKIAAYCGLISTDEAVFHESSEGALGTTSVQLDFPTDVPFRLLNNYGFDLAVEEHREMLWAEVERERPVLLILDPLYLILGGADQNQAAQLVPFLKWILALRYEFDCAVAIIHHMRKQQQGGAVVRAGQRLMGNATLHGFVDSALYTSALEESRSGWTKTLIETEFRSMAPQKPIELGLRMGPPGGLDMEVEISGFDFEGMLVGIVRQEPGVTVADLCKRLNVDKRTLLSRIRGSETGAIRIEEGGKGRGKSHKLFIAE